MNYLKGVLGGGIVIGVVFLLLIVSPALALWVINSLAEAGGASFYIEHNLWNYFVAIVLLIMVRGGSSN